MLLCTQTDSIIYAFIWNKAISRAATKSHQKAQVFLDLAETFVDLLVPHPDGNITDREILFFYASLFSNTEEIMHVS